MSPSARIVQTEDRCFGVTGVGSRTTLPSLERDSISRNRRHQRERKLKPATRGRGFGSAKLFQANPSKGAWISLVLFVGMGTFQWVAPQKIRQLALLSLRLGRLERREFDPASEQR
jgi:hypothetical protein